MLQESNREASVPRLRRNPASQTIAHLPCNITVSASDVAVFANVDLWLANNDGAPGQLRFYESNSNVGAFPPVAAGSEHYSSFEAGVQSASMEYILPTAAGAVGDVLKIAAINGNRVTLTWGADNTGTVDEGKTPNLSIAPEEASGGSDHRTNALTEKITSMEHELYQLRELLQGRHTPMKESGELRTRN